jgi:hypothetical protein
LPGTIPSGVTDEAGNPVKTAKAGQSTSYYIYLSYKAGSTILPSALWIHGAPYAFRIEGVAQTPVVHATPNNPQDAIKNILVPKTRDSVVRLIVASPINPLPVLMADEKKLVADSAVVVRYEKKGKTYYAGTGSIKKLAPLMHQ